MTIARLAGGPLDGQVIPLDDTIDDAYIASYGEGQIVYRRVGEPINTGTDDGPTEVTFQYVESTEPLDPTAADVDDVPDV